VVNAIAHNHIKKPRLTKERFAAGAAAAMPMAGRLLLRIRLRFHNHAPKQAAVLLAFHQQAPDQLGGIDLGRASKEGLEEGWEGFYGFGSGCCCLVLAPSW
jgi:hypothetical protein